MKLVAGQATSQAMQWPLLNPRLQRLPGFHGLGPLGERFDGQVHLSLIGQFELSIRLEQATNYGRRDLGCHVQSPFRTARIVPRLLTSSEPAYESRCVACSFSVLSSPLS